MFGFVLQISNLVAEKELKLRQVCAQICCLELNKIIIVDEFFILLL